MIKFYRDIVAKPGSGMVLLGLVFCGVAALLSSDMALAADTGLAKIATDVEEQVKALSGLLIITAYVAGIGFVLSGVIKFKAHRDNPTQVPLSAPIVLLCVGAALLFLPAVMKSAGSTIFGDDATSSQDGTVDL